VRRFPMREDSTWKMKVRIRVREFLGRRVD
jgi:hypothetical protein